MPGSNRSTIAVPTTAWSLNWLLDTNGTQGNADLNLPWFNTSDYADLNALVTAAGAGPYVVNVTAHVHCTANLILAAGIHLIAQPNFDIEVDNGVTLTINSAEHVHVNPRQKIFTLTGTGKVAWTRGGTVYPGWWGAVGDDATNCSAAFAAAMTSIVAAGIGGTIVVPEGIYQTDKLTVWGSEMRLCGAGLGRTILKSRAGDHVIEITGLTVRAIEIDHLTIQGNGGAGHGIYVHDNVIDVSRLYLHDLYVTATGGAGIYCLDVFTFLGLNIDLHACGHHAIEIWAGNTSVLQNCFVHDVADNHIAYRLASGQWTLIGCNGITGGATADWAVVGANVAEDGVNEICRVDFIGCNIEDYTNHGVRFKFSSWGCFINTSFIAPTAGTVSPLEYEIYPGPNLMPIWTGGYITSKGAAYTDGQIVHAEGPPFVQIGDQITSYRTAGGVVQTVPRITPDYYGAANSNWLNVQPGLRVNGTMRADGGIQVLNGASSAGWIDGYEDSDNGTNKLRLAWPDAISADDTINVPETGGTMAVSQQVSHNYGGAAADWNMTAREAAATYFIVTNANAPANAIFPAAVAGKIFTVYNNSGQTITFKVSGQVGATSTNAKRSIWISGDTDVAKIYEQP